MIVGIAIEAWLERQSRHPKRWLALFAVPLAIQIGAYWLPTPDSVAYLSIARSIVSGHGLANLGYAHLAYPPGYPLLISSAFLISPIPFLAISAIHWLMAVALMLGLYRWTSQRAQPAALILTGLVMVNVTLWIYYHRTLSELAFMAVMIWTVVALNDGIEARQPYQRVMGTIAGTFLLVLLAMIREVGVLFGLGFLLALGFAARSGKLRWRSALWMAAAVVVPGAAGVVAFMMYDQATVHVAQAGAVFGTHLSGFIGPAVPFAQRALEGLRLQISAVGRLLVPGMFKSYGHRWVDINVAVYVLVFAFVVIGWWRCVRRDREVYALTFPLYFALYVTWGFDADARYLLPMLPIIAVSLWRMMEPYSSWRLTGLAALLVAHFAVASGYWAIFEVPRGRECNSQWKPISRLANSLKDRPGTVVAEGEVPECARLTLSFILDRPVVDERVNEAGISGARWLLVPANNGPVDGFGTAAAEGGYKILGRIQDTPVTAR
jgi:hypothetical protein